ncbi:MAG: HIT domain-containing protein [Saprospiraceae bacterium]|nr:HIT domain-containing protein [Saprospiraceae bacterium]
MEDIYCKQILPGKLKVDIIFETERVMAFHHTRPYWEHHVVIIPKTHIESLSTIPDDYELNRDLFDAMRMVTSLFEEKYGGCRISSNVGNYQTSKHLHWYIHYGRRLVKESESPEH